MKEKIKIGSYLAFFVYIIVLLKLILFKGTYNAIYHHFTQNYSWALVEKHFHSMNIFPFSTIFYYLRGQDTTGTIPNLLGNILIFIPFGLLLPLLNRKFTSFKYLIKSAFAFSFLFETIQLIIAYGTFDIDDCILNTIGAIFGFLIYKYFESAFSLNNEVEIKEHVNP